MRRVVIESPYKGDVDANKSYLQKCIRHCLARNESPYASHQMLTEALDDNDPSQRALGIKAGLEWRRAADCRLFYVDRGWSDGMWKAWDLYQEEGLSTEIRRISRT